MARPLTLAVFLIAAAIAADARAATFVLVTGGGLRAPPTAQSGGTIQVEVGGNAPSVEITDQTTGIATSHEVVGKTATITLPAAPTGTVFMIRVGRGNRARYCQIEIVES